jgi:hypothetical protein
MFKMAAAPITDCGDKTSVHRVDTSTDVNVTTSRADIQRKQSTSPPNVAAELQETSLPNFASLFVLQAKYISQ